MSRKIGIFYNIHAILFVSPEIIKPEKIKNVEFLEEESRR